MRLEPIKYKLYTDEKGLLMGLELHQGNSYITIDLSAPGTHENGYRWTEIKPKIDKISEEYKTSLTKELTDKGYKTDES